MKLLNPLERRNIAIARALQGSLLALAFLLSVLWLAALCFNDQRLHSSPLRLPLPALDYLRIGKGPLSISPRAVSPELEPLAQELIVMGKNTRPDSGVLAAVCLGLKSAGAKKELVLGQKIFLSGQGAAYQFSDTETDLAVIPLAAAGSDVLLQVERAGQKEELLISPSPLFQNSLEDELYVQCLKKGKMWAPDMFLHQWGGDEYRELGSKHKIEIDNKVYFLAVGDSLWWEGGSWNTGPQPLMLQTPIAKVAAVTPQGAQIDVWDASGYASASMELLLQKGLRAPVKAEEVITSVRPRSANEVTCQLGKRRVIVKEGDWWVKTDPPVAAVEKYRRLGSVSAPRASRRTIYVRKSRNVKGQSHPERPLL